MLLAKGYTTKGPVYASTVNLSRVAGDGVGPGDSCNLARLGVELESFEGSSISSGAEETAS